MPPRRLVLSLLVLVCVGCAATHERRSAITDAYAMNNGCTGLTNRFLNQTADDCEKKAGADENKLKACVARAVGESCLARNNSQNCAIECLQDITHPDR